MAVWGLGSVDAPCPGPPGSPYGSRDGRPRPSPCLSPHPVGQRAVGRASPTPWPTAAPTAAERRKGEAFSLVCVSGGGGGGGWLTSPDCWYPLTKDTPWGQSGGGEVRRPTHPPYTPPFWQGCPGDPSLAHLNVIPAPPNTSQVGHSGEMWQAGGGGLLPLSLVTPPPHGAPTQSL